jgi:hypothetical protein
MLLLVLARVYPFDPAAAHAPLIPPYSRGLAQTITIRASATVDGVPAGAGSCELTRWYRGPVYACGGVPVPAGLLQRVVVNGVVVTGTALGDGRVWVGSGLIVEPGEGGVR